MKINETILLESFNDLKRFIGQYFMSVFGTTNPSTADWIAKKNDDPALYQAVNSLASLQRDLRHHVPDFPKEHPINSKALLEVIRFSIKDQRMQNWGSLNNTGTWIRLFKMSTSSNNFLPYSTLQQIYQNTITYLIENPPKQKPKITEITKTRHFHIFELENYEAAVKVKNTFGVRWCIGSDRGWFGRYGEDLGRKTYVVSLPNKTVFAIHSSSSSSC